MAVIAVDCGGTNLVYGRFDAAGEGASAGVAPAPRVAAEIPVAVAAAVLPLVDASVSAVGVGCAGLVDHGRGMLVWSPHASGSDVALRDELAAALARPVVVDNDANLAALAEARRGAGVGYRMVLFLGLGTGIGGGLVIDGEPERGRGFLGELGHMALDSGGPPCACGGRGCWEALVSGTSLGRAAQDLAAQDPGGGVARLVAAGPARGEHLSAAAAAGDSAACAVFETAGRWLGRGLANLVAALDPDVIVIGGAAADAGDLLLGPARTMLAEAVEGAGHRAATPVVPARFGPRAGLVGAALAAGGAR